MLDADDGRPQSHREWNVKDETAWDKRGDAVIVIDSHDALVEFRASLRLPSLPSATRIELDERFAGEDADQLEERLNDVYLDCGCDMGALALGLAAAGFVGWLLVTGASFGWATGIRGALILFAAAVVGKIAGLVRNRFALASLIASIGQRAPRRSERSS